MNGSSSGDSTMFPNSVLFNCDPGFLLDGSSSRTCQANGTWSGLSTSCVGMSKVRIVRTGETHYTCFSLVADANIAYFHKFRAFIVR